MSRRSLQEIYERDCTPFGDGDKGTYHSYISHYEKMLEPLRDDAFFFMEIGIASGRSIRMWREYLTAATIFAVDVHDKSHLRLGDDNTVVLQADAADASFAALLPSQPFSVVIDDGSHRLDEQRNTFATLRTRMAHGGLYIIEDVLPEHIEPLQDAFPGAWHVMDLRHERPQTPDNILLVHRCVLHDA